jgi:hypothetical protein
MTEYFFWFAQPSSVLNTYDWVFGYIFAGLTALGIIVWLANKFLARHPVIKKLMGRYATAVFWIGLVGLLWFGLRYEAVPIFSKRVFAGGIMAIGLIWLGFVKWYFVSKFFREKREHDYNQVKSRYMPGKK